MSVQVKINIIYILTGEISINTKASNKILESKTISHLYKCLWVNISNSINITAIHKNKVTISKRWKRNSINVVKNKILFIPKIYLLNLDIEKLDFPFNIWSNWSLIAFSFFMKFSDLEKSSIFLPILKLLSLDACWFCSLGKDCWNWFSPCSPSPSKFMLPSGTKFPPKPSLFFSNDLFSFFFLLH